MILFAANVIIAFPFPYEVYEIIICLLYTSDAADD